MTEFRLGVTTEDAALGMRIRARRLALGLGQADVGKSIGVSYQQVQKYEAGKDRLSGARLGRLAAALQTDANTLLGNTLKADHPTRVLEEFMASKEGAAIAKHFGKLDLPTKRAIVRLVESLAGQQKRIRVDDAARKRPQKT